MTDKERAWRVGSVLGVPVLLSWGWLVAAVVLTVILLPFARLVAPDARPLGQWLLAAFAVLLMFGSTFVHELAHAAVARRHGMPAQRIVLTLLGGHTELGGQAPGPKASALVAVAGPVSNLLIAALAWAVRDALPRYGVAASLVVALAFVNAFVGVLNLVPGLPLDGGYLLEAAVWAVTGRRATGTRAAGWGGRVAAVVIVAWTLAPALRGGLDTTQAIWGLLVGGFVWSGASQALRHAGVEQALEGLSVAALMRPAVGVLADRPMSALDAAVPAGAAVVLVDGSGAPLGYVDAAAVASVPVALRADTPLSVVAARLPSDACVPVGAVGRAALAAVQHASAQSSVMAVIDPAGRVVGVLEAVAVARALRQS